ncbi:MAG: hypothetical protein LZF62_410201 [Nitrospira sp.]|nr:MAG: hypothetical protein LZF62_410201 [Nitrospira sp.]
MSCPARSARKSGRIWAIVRIAKFFSIPFAKRFGSASIALLPLSQKKIVPHFDARS